MSESPIFDWVSEALQRRTALSRIEARGTVRLALREAGLEPRALTAKQMGVVLDRVLPGALRRRKIEDADRVCAEMARGLASFAERSDVQAEDSAYDVFRRLGED